MITTSQRVSSSRVASKGSLIELGQPFSKMARLALRQVMTRIEEGKPTSQGNSSGTNKLRPKYTVKMRANLAKLQIH